MLAVLKPKRDERREAEARASRLAVPVNGLQGERYALAIHVSDRHPSFGAARKARSRASS
jgi:hypothetical protein